MQLIIFNIQFFHIFLIFKTSINYKKTYFAIMFIQMRILKSYLMVTFDESRSVTILGAFSQFLTFDLLL